MARDTKRPGDEHVDGPRVAAEIIKRLPPEHRARLVSAIQQAAPDIALSLEENLFNFDEICDLTPPSIQRVIAEVVPGDLILALKVASPEVSHALLSNMSDRRRRAAEAELAALPPQRLTDIEQAQRRILAKIDALRSAGSIHRTERKDLYV